MGLEESMWKEKLRERMPAFAMEAVPTISQIIVTRALI